jgi:hypothetical protein
MIWRQKGRIGIRSFPQYYGHPIPISTEQRGILHSTWFTYAVLAPEIFLESAQAALFNEENQAEVRELDPNLLEEKHNKALAIVQKY